MTTEISYFVRIAAALQPTVQQLNRRATVALRRAAKLPAGDRTEALRFEALQAAIEQLALASLWGGESHEAISAEGYALDGEAPTTTVLLPETNAPAGAPSKVRAWLRQGAVVVELRLPHRRGETQLGGADGLGPPPPAPRWKSSADRPRDALLDRFQHLISTALAEDGSSEAVIRPSDINNSVLTETLRQHVAALPGMRRLDLPVRYRDGSHGPPFPLRVLSLSADVPDGLRVLRFTLLSIRHVEMDTLVDGAWFRNAKISLPREAGLTDRLAFDTSMQQLRLLLPQGPTVIHLYQTGLETAVLGFYRAITHHLIENPGAVSVVPHYYRGPGQFTEGTPWTTA